MKRQHAVSDRFGGSRPLPTAGHPAAYLDGRPEGRPESQTTAAFTDDTSTRTPGPIEELTATFCR